MTCQHECPHAYCDAIRRVSRGQHVVMLIGVDTEDGEPMILMRYQRLTKAAKRYAKHEHQLVRAGFVVGALGTIWRGVRQEGRMRPLEPVR